jgi:flagellar basal body rod protein FlgG
VDNSVYIVLSKQMATFRKMEMVANNIANVNTVGFQAERMLFNDYLVDDGNRHKMAFAQDIATYHERGQGALKQTGNQLDFAIEGEGYFMVRLPNGETGYTRAGNMRLDGQGFIIDAQGRELLDGEGNAIQINPEDEKIVVGDDGTMLVNGEQRVVVGMAEFANPQLLEQYGGNTMVARNGAAPIIPAQNSRMLQGMLEDSNASPIQELVEMTMVSRGVTNTAKFIEVMYDLQRKTSNAYTRANG